MKEGDQKPKDEPGRWDDWLGPESGIANDYVGIFATLESTLHTGGLADLIEVVQMGEIKPYMEYYASRGVFPVAVITDKNREGIKRLDEIVAIINDVVKNPEIYTVEGIRELIQEAMRIIQPHLQETGSDDLK